MKVTDTVDTLNSQIDLQGKANWELIGGAPELGGAQNHSIFFVAVKPGQSVTAHYHKVHEETYYILRGAAFIVVDGQRSTLTEGQAVLLMPGEVHEIGCEGQDQLDILAITSPPFDPNDVYLVE